jgi:hypothetical protein
MSTFPKLWESHPTGEFLCSTDWKKNFYNQCAIRMGEFFEKAGIRINNWPEGVVGNTRAAAGTFLLLRNWQTP